mmetsp:Transcript_14691/g.49739  ORF Transcript_14691/g.49739 Transcript_14691/m.49739 type:complete len:121 (+) Transcript_14691:306-668(+)
MGASEQWVAMSRESEMDALAEVADLLRVGLDRRTLELLVELVECGVNPEALADVVLDLRREAARLPAPPAAAGAGAGDGGGDADAAGSGGGPPPPGESVAEADASPAASAWRRPQPSGLF